MAGSIRRTENILRRRVQLPLMDTLKKLSAFTCATHAQRQITHGKRVDNLNLDDRWTLLRASHLRNVFSPINGFCADASSELMFASMKKAILPCVFLEAVRSVY